VRYGAVDVYYPPSGGARAALVVAVDPTFATIVDERVAWLAHVAPYEPGSFFRRELPATRAVLDGVQDLGLLVVDGYVDLDPDGRVSAPTCTTRLAWRSSGWPRLPSAAPRMLWSCAAASPHDRCTSPPPASASSKPPTW
jgi:hypothetical protein